MDSGRVFPAIPLSTYNGDPMHVPKLPARTRPFLWGAAAGAIALAIVGFSWGGWVTGAKAKTLAGDRAEAAVVSALAPICVAQFRKSTDPAASLAVRVLLTPTCQTHETAD